MFKYGRTVDDNRRVSDQGLAKGVDSAATVDMKGVNKQCRFAFLVADILSL